ncbi:MAG TPA: RecQ family ATP-dependent DNA helicase [Gemmatimonadales bacterium]|nr:RecQ family ATP-dependent DNA helicase [Gemmatimonadales bacterium]
MSPTMDEARSVLRRHFGYGDFRPAQAPVVESILGGSDTLAVLPTGAGKSVCFQVPAMVLGGLTVVVSPLISLMQDQVAAAEARGIPAASLTSGLTTDEQAEVHNRLLQGQLRLLYLSPERLERFAPELRAAGIRPALLAVDEAHCIAEWGHDFRPSYRALLAARYRLGRPPAVALTGSATPAVRDEIARALGFGVGKFAEHLGSFDRENLWFGVVRVADERDRLQALRRLVSGDDRMAIVYAPTRSVTEGVARALVAAGHRAAPYHAGLDRARRAAILDAFLADRIDVVVATCAFGMGIDKPTVRLVVHWTLPPTPESYYQEAGRAGRDGELARCVLLWHPRDSTLHRRQLDVTFPPRRTLERIWRNPAKTTGVPENVRESAQRLGRELRPDLGPVDWEPVRQRRRRAEERLRAIEQYARGNACRRRALVGYFGESLAACSGCDRCRADPAPRPLPPAVAARVGRLRQALGGKAGPWGACLLEPDVLLRLARNPPADTGALADVPGVGPAVAQRYGATILGALGVEAGSGSRAERGAAERALEEWRAAVAREMGVPAYVVLGDGALAQLAAGIAVEGRVTRSGVGPRFRAKFDAELRRLLARLERSPATSFSRPGP